MIAGSFGRGGGVRQDSVEGHFAVSFVHEQVAPFAASEFDDGLHFFAGQGRAGRIVGDGDADKFGVRGDRGLEIVEPDLPVVFEFQIDDLERGLDRARGL